MLDIKFIRENPQLVQETSKNKGFEVDIQHLLEIDQKHKELLLSAQKLREERNRLAQEKNIEEGKRIKNQLEKEERALRAVEEEREEWLYKIPNLPKADVKVGKNEMENKVIKKYKEPTKFTFVPKDHLELGESLDIIDVKSAAKVSGSRFFYFKNEVVLLEFALVQLALEILTKEGFVPVIPPVLIRTEIMRGLGYMEHEAEEDMFILPKDELVLVGTAEHSIVSMHKDELFNKKDLPKRYVGFSTCFRREAGSYGKDTRGVLRVHQFDKIEMVSFVEEGLDEQEQEYLLSLEEKLFQMLEIPYQVVKMCTGDLGFPAARKYDIEAWIPTQNKYREVTSVSTVTDFQSRRLNIRYQENSGKKYTYVLNGTAFAMPRTIIAILENYQNQDGSVTVPKVLQKYLSFSTITPKNVIKK